MKTQLTHFPFGAGKLMMLVSFCALLHAGFGQGSTADAAITLTFKNFIVPATILEEFIAKGKVHPMMSDISMVYEEAMELYDASRYKKALAKFEEVKDMNKAFPFVDKYIADTKRKIEKGLDKEPTNMMIYVYIGGGVLLLALILFFAFRKKKKS